LAAALHFFQYAASLFTTTQFYRCRILSLDITLREIANFLKPDLKKCWISDAIKIYRPFFYSSSCGDLHQATFTSQHCEYDLS